MRPALVVAVLLCCIAVPVHAQVFKCTVNGKAVYGDQPCGSDQRVLLTTLKVNSGLDSGGPSGGNVYDTQLRARIAAALATKDYGRAEGLAVTESHWAMISEARRSDAQAVAAAKAAKAANRPIHCFGSSSTTYDYTSTHTTCR